MNEITQIVEVYNKFKARDWIPGGAGAIAQLCYVSESSKKIYVTPDMPIGCDLVANDLFALRDLYGIQDIQAPLNQLDKGLKITKIVSVLLEVLTGQPQSPCVVQSAPLYTILAARYALHQWAKKGDSHPNILRLSHWNLIHRLNSDETKKELLIPVVNYTSPEELAKEVRETLKTYADSCAIIIRDYGVLVWGKTLADVYNRTELLEHICKLQVHDGLLFEKLEPNS